MYIHTVSTISRLNVNIISLLETINLCIKDFDIIIHSLGVERRLSLVTMHPDNFNQVEIIKTVVPKI